MKRHMRFDILSMEILQLIFIYWVYSLKRDVVVMNIFIKKSQLQT